MKGKEITAWTLFAASVLALLFWEPCNMTPLGLTVMKTVAAWMFVTSLSLLDVLEPRRKKGGKAWRR